MIDYTGLEFPAARVFDRPYVVVNMVSSLDGRSVIETTEAGLGSTLDRRLMRELRVHADVVMLGAATLRTTDATPRPGSAALEHLRAVAGKRPTAVSAVISRWDRQFFTAEDYDAVVYVADSCAPEAVNALEQERRPVVRVPAGDPALATLTHMQESLGAELVLLEGGPTLLSMFLQSDLVDEVFITIGPVLIGGDRPSIVASAGPQEGLMRRMHLVHLLSDQQTSEVFARYRRAGSSL